MLCSTVIPTIGRPELTRAVRSVLEQTFTADEYEIIVVNDSGRPLRQADWQASERVRILHTNCRERSVARNAGAALARGRYLHFLDDDDWLLPGALESFWDQVHRARGAVCCYGRSQLVDRAGNPIIQLHHGLTGNCFVQVMAGEWIPLQASFIQEKAFFDVGGFNPLIPSAEDIDLLRRIALRGDLVEIPAVVACVGMGLEKSSTDYERAPHHSRWAREEILDKQGVFTRMRKSANSSYWNGRIVRVYLTSMVWNLRRKRGFTAMSRAVFGAAGLALASWRMVSPSFWRAVSRPYESETFLRGFREVNRPVESRDLRQTGATS